MIRTIMWLIMGAVIYANRVKIAAIIVIVLKKVRERESVIDGVLGYVSSSTGRYSNNARYRQAPNKNIFDSLSHIGNEIKNDEAFKAIISTGKAIKEDLTKKIENIRSRMINYLSELINENMEKAMESILSKNQSLTESQITEIINMSINNMYKDLIKNINLNTRQSREDFLEDVRKIILEKNRYDNSGKREVVDIGISKIIDEMGTLYKKELRDLEKSQFEAIKSEMEKNLNRQMDILKKGVGANNLNSLDTEALTKSIKNHIDKIEKTYIVESYENIENTLSVISQDMKKLREEFNIENLSEEMKKSLEEFKENDFKQIQGSVDQILEITEQIKNYKNAQLKTIKNRDIRLKMEEAFKIAESEIDIISPWISDRVMEKTNISKEMNMALRKGIKLRIHCGIGDIGSSIRSKDDYRGSTTQKWVEKMRRDFSIYGEAFKIKTGNTHSKVLICDEKFALVGSYNFLSFTGDYIEDRREELVVLITDKDAIRDIRRREFGF